MTGAGCGPSHAGPTRPPPPPPGTEAPGDALLLGGMRGAWRWIHGSQEDGTYRLERERWLLEPISADPETGQKVVLGRYRRDVAVVALDGKPFLCNQQPAYVQSAVFDVRVTATGGELRVEELGYRTGASPCEPGFRRVGAYRATLDRPYVTLAWEGGEQTLQRVPDDSFATGDLELTALPAETAARFSGSWRWSMRSYDDENQVHEEEEAWELAVAADGTAGGTYVREVTVSSADGSDLDCVGAPSWRFTDRYTLRGKLVDGILDLEEVAVDAGKHVCLAATPDRHLDTATGFTVGEHILLTWRGKRKQVLHRE